MFDKHFWPFTPTCLSEIVDPETLAVIESGSCERLKRPLTILAYNCTNNGFERVESFNEKQRYEEFCRVFREKESRDEACKNCDVEEALRSLYYFEKTGRVYREFSCHLNLMDMTCLIRIHGHPVALVFSGQFLPPDGADPVQRAVESYWQINEDGATDMDRLRQLSLIEHLSSMPADAGERLQLEASYIQRIAESEYERVKSGWEEEFLDELRRISIEAGPINRQNLSQTLTLILGKIVTFCRCKYAVFYGSDQEGSVVLAQQAQVGLPTEVALKPPHFNWRKAGFPLAMFDLHARSLDEWLSDTRDKGGFRGENFAFFEHAACVLPASLGDRYRGVLVLGEFAEPVELKDENRFLIELSKTVALFSLNGLELLYLEQERFRWQNTARLLAHQLKTALTPVNNQIGQALMALERKGAAADMQKIKDLLKQAEDMVMNLSQSTRETLNGHVLHVEPGDCDFQSYPLSVLVQNCASGFFDVARNKGCNLVVDNTIELLPEADVDVGRLTIALANLLDNAMKYCFCDTKIFVYARIAPHASLEQTTVTIIVDDIGYGFHPDEMQRIFDLGTRSRSVIHLERVRGSGLGLWEARSILRAHGGDLRATSTSTGMMRREGRPHKVVVEAELPMRQKKRTSSGGKDEKRKL